MVMMLGEVLEVLGEQSLQLVQKQHSADAAQSHNDRGLTEMKHSSKSVWILINVWCPNPQMLIVNRKCIFFITCTMFGWYCVCVFSPMFHFLMISAYEDSQVGGSGAIDHILRRQRRQMRPRVAMLVLFTRHRPLKYTDVRKGVEWGLTFK